MIAAEEFIDEITLSNAMQADIKGYIRKQARRIRELEAKLEMIRLREQEKKINRHKKSLQRLLSPNQFY